MLYCIPGSGIALHIGFPGSLLSPVGIVISPLISSIRDWSYTSPQSTGRFLSLVLTILIVPRSRLLRRGFKPKIYDNNIIIRQCCIVCACIEPHIELELDIENGITRFKMNRFITLPTQNESTVTICVTDILGDRFCVVCEDGKRVYEHVATALKAGKKVHLSFRGGEEITSAFLAEAFSRLYTNFSEEHIESNLTFTDIDPDDAADIECVIQDVKDYLNNPQQFENAIIQAMGEDAI